MRAKISIALLSISLIASFGLTSNQAFAGIGVPEDCEDCQILKNFCETSRFFSDEARDQCFQNYMDCSAQFCRAVGGEFIGIETTSVLAAGAQYTAAWMIPVIVSGIGIAIVITRKF